MKRIAAAAIEPDNPTVRYARLKLKGETFSLAYDFNGLAVAEDLSGINLMQAFRSLGDLSISQTRALLFAALRKRHPKITLNEVGDLMEFEALPAITRAISEALENSMPANPPEPAPEAEPEPAKS